MQQNIAQDLTSTVKDSEPMVYLGLKDYSGRNLSKKPEETVAWFEFIEFLKLLRGQLRGLSAFLINSAN
jgi:hypothetical protein